MFTADADSDIVGIATRLRVALNAPSFVTDLLDHLYGIRLGALSVPGDLFGKRDPVDMGKLIESARLMLMMHSDHFPTYGYRYRIHRRVSIEYQSRSSIPEYRETEKFIEIVKALRPWLVLSENDIVLRRIRPHAYREEVIAYNYGNFETWDGHEYQTDVEGALVDPFHPATYRWPEDIEVLYRVGATPRNMRPKVKEPFGLQWNLRDLDEAADKRVLLAAGVTVREIV